MNRKIKIAQSLGIKGRTVLLFLIFIGMAAFLLCSCVRMPEEPLRVGTNVWPGYECLYLARDLGYYKGTAIDLVEFPSASEVIRAYRNKTIEVAALTFDEVLYLSTVQKRESRVVLITDISTGGDAIIAKSEFEDMQSLRGRRIGVESSALGAFVITRALEKAGMSKNDIVIVTLEVSEHERAFKEGQVDAVVTFEPVRSKLLDLGGRILFDSSQIPNEIVDVLVVSEEVMSSNGCRSLKILIEGWFRAIEYLRENPRDAARLIAPREGVKPKQFLQMLELIKIPDLEENKKILGKSDELFNDGMHRLYKIMLEKDLLKKQIDPLSLLDDRIVRMAGK